MGRRSNADGTVAVQVLMENRLERFQRGAFARDRTGCRRREEVAIAVDVPDRVLIGALQMQRNLITAGCLFRPYKRPGAKLAYNER